MDRKSIKPSTIGISVIIPCFNSSKTIVRALHSVLMQIYQPVEVIIVNDGSQDDSQLIVEKWIQNQTRNTNTKYLLLSQANSGPSKARNFAIERAKTEYIAFLDSDDYWLPHHLSTAVTVITSYNSKNIVISSSPLIHAQINTLINKSQIIYKKLSLRYMLILQRGYTTPSIIAPKKLVESAGMFPHDKRHCEDLELFLKLRIKADEWISIQSPLSVVVGKHLWASGKGLSSNHWAMYRQTIHSIKRTLNMQYFSPQMIGLEIFYALKYIRRFMYLLLK